MCDFIYIECNMMGMGEKPRNTIKQKAKPKKRIFMEEAESIM